MITTVVTEQPVLGVRPGSETELESAFCEEWKALLHGFHDPLPVVEHYSAVVETHPGGDSVGHR